VWKLGDRIGTRRKKGETESRRERDQETFKKGIGKNEVIERCGATRRIHRHKYTNSALVGLNIIFAQIVAT